MKDYLFGALRKHPREMASLNGIRTIAIFMLVYVHMFRTPAPNYVQETWWLTNFLNNGSQSIDMFFVLSGFLISAPLLRDLQRTHTMDLKMFFMKRSLRIFPPYFIFLFLWYFMVIPTFPAEFREFASTWIWSDILYVSNYLPRTLIHGWSLSLEEQFYLVFPIFLLFVYRKTPEKWRLPLLGFVTILPMLWRWGYLQFVMLGLPEIQHKTLYNEQMYYPFHGHIDSIFFGIIAAYIFDNRPQWIQWLMERVVLRRVVHASAWLTIIGYSFLIDEFETGFLSMVIRYNVFSIAWAIVMILTLREGSFLNRILSWGIWTPFAKLSYCAYIIHVVIMVPAARSIFLKYPKVTEVDILIWFIPVGLVIFFFAYLFHLVAERPFMIWRDKIAQRMKAKAAAAS